MSAFFEYEFLLRALVAGLLAGFLAPLVGQFLVVRRLPLLADTLAHVSLLGVSVSLVAGLPPLLGAGVFVVIMSAAMEKLRKSSGISGESVLALFLSGALALALIVASFSPQKTAGLYSYLFGSLTTVSSHELWLLTGLSLLVFVTVAFFYKQFILVSWQEDLAEASGLRSGRLGLLLTVLAALVVVVSLRVVGVLLMGALMVVPVNAVMLFRQGFTRTLLGSVAVSLLSVWLGLWLSLRLDLPPGAVIVAVCLVLFVLSLSIKKIGN